MVRLIRLTNNTDDGKFINNFNANLELSPFSQVAFKGCNIDLPSPSIRLDAGNNQIVYDSELTTFTSNIPAGTYSSSEENIETLNSEVAATLNNMMVTTASNHLPVGRQIGQQWKADVGRRGKYEIQYETCNATNFTDEYFLNEEVTESGSATNSEFVRSSAGTGDDSYLASKFPLGKGNSRTFIELKTVGSGSGTANTRGVTIGLTTTDFAANEEQPTLADMECSVTTSDSSHTYFYTDGLGATPVAATSGAAAVGDKVALYKNGDAFHVGAWDTTESNLFQHKMILTAEPDVDYYIVVFFFDTSVTIEKTQWSPDPYQINGECPNTYFTFTTLPNPLLISETKAAKLNISEDLASFLGYDSPHLQNPTNAAALWSGVESILGDTILNTSTTKDSYMIELLSLNIDSYDGYTQQRKSILATIEYNEFGDSIVYEPNQYVYLDLNNKQTINLRNISARVVTEDWQNVETKGFNTITIYIKDGKERTERAFIN